MTERSPDARAPGPSAATGAKVPRATPAAPSDSAMPGAPGEAAARVELDHQFAMTNLDHPAVRCLYDLCLQQRLHPLPPASTPADST